MNTTPFHEDILIIVTFLFLLSSFIGSWIVNFNSTINELFFKTRLKDIVISRYKNSPPNFLPKQDYKILKGLKDDHGIVLIKPDKGNSIVILDKADTILSDTLRVTIHWEIKLCTFLHSLKNENIISDELY